MQFVQVSFEPQTFEIHALLATVEIKGVPVTIPIVSDCGILSAVWVIEARLVNVRTGQVIKRVQVPSEGSASELMFEPGMVTYDFQGQAISDWENTEVWLYYKVGENRNGQFQSPAQARWFSHIMKFKLSDRTIWIEYGGSRFSASIKEVAGMNKFWFGLLSVLISLVGVSLLTRPPAQAATAKVGCQPQNLTVRTG